MRHNSVVVRESEKQELVASDLCKGLEPGGRGSDCGSSGIQSPEEQEYQTPATWKRWMFQYKQRDHIFLLRFYSSSALSTLEEVHLHGQGTSLISVKILCPETALEIQ